MHACLLEHHLVEMTIATGVGDRLQREGLRHEGVWLAFNGARYRIDFAEVTGKQLRFTGRNEVVKDLIDARVKTGVRCISKSKT